MSDTAGGFVRAIVWVSKLLAFLVLTGALYGFFLFLYLEIGVAALVGDELDALTARHRNVSAEVDNAALTAARLDEFRREVANTDQQLQRLRELLPHEPDVGALTSRIQNVANRHQVTVAASRFTETEHELYTAISVELEIAATLPSTGTFLYELGARKRVVNIRSLKMERVRESEYTTTVRLDAFSYSPF